MFFYSDAILKIFKTFRKNIRLMFLCNYVFGSYKRSLKNFSVARNNSIQSRSPNRYGNIFKKTVTIWRIFEFSSIFSWQFSKISKKIANRNDLVVDKSLGYLLLLGPKNLGSAEKNENFFDNNVSWYIPDSRLSRERK